MSAEMIRLGQALIQVRTHRPAQPLRPVAGVLADGTAFFAPVGEVVIDGSLVTCHLCGRSFRSVVAHLSAHGWTKERYCEAFGLERGQSLEGPETRKLRAAAFTARLLFEPAVREGSAAGRERARGGDLARDAAAAARGRSFPEQRRRKTVLARAAIPFSIAAQASRDPADRHLIAVAADAARRQGYPDIGACVAARTQAGASLAAISREAGLHKDWLSRYLGRVDPAAAQSARLQAAGRHDIAWLPALRHLGYRDVAAYLRDRHLEQRQTVNAIAGRAWLLTPCRKVCVPPSRPGHGRARRQAWRGPAALSRCRRLLGLPDCRRLHQRPQIRWLDLEGHLRRVWPAGNVAAPAGGRAGSSNAITVGGPPEMVRFLVTYYPGDMPRDPASVAEARDAFRRWAGKAGPALADLGEPVRSATTVSGDGARDRATGEPLMGWSVIEAPDGAAAVRLMRDHPFIRRGGVLQISEPI